MSADKKYMNFVPAYIRNELSKLLESNLSLRERWGIAKAKAEAEGRVKKIIADFLIEEGLAKSGLKKSSTTLVENADERKNISIILTDTSLPNIPNLTPEYLSNIIVPYLNSIIELQQLIDTIKRQKPITVNIRDIKRNSPISVSLDGASEAIQLIKDTVVPWRRKHAETMARLLEQEKLVDIESKKAEVLEKRAIANKEREQASKVKLETEKLQFELQQAKLKLAIEMLDNISRNLSQAEKEISTKKLLTILDTLAFGRLDMVSDK